MYRGWFSIVNSNNGQICISKNFGILVPVHCLEFFVLTILTVILLVNGLAIVATNALPQVAARYGLNKGEFTRSE